MDCEVKVQGVVPVNHMNGLLVNSTFGEEEVSNNIVNVEGTVDCEQQETDVNTVNKWEGAMPIGIAKTPEKERLLKPEVHENGDIELNGYISNSYNGELNAKLLVEDPDDDSLSSIGEDTSTFSTSKLIITTEISVDVDEINDGDIDHKNNNGDNDNNNNNTEHLSNILSGNDQKEGDLSIQIPEVSVHVNTDASETHRTEFERQPSTESTESTEIRQSIKRTHSNEEISLSSMGDPEQTTTDTHGDSVETSFSIAHNIRDTEDSRLLQPEEPEELPDEEEIEVGEEEAEEGSVHSLFLGSLGINVLEIPWETDIDRVVDIQLGEEEWSTTIHKPEGGLNLADWESKILEISKEEDLTVGWNTTINQISDDQELETEWSTEIAEQFENKELKIDWSTKFNTIEKADEGKNKWTTRFRKIKEHISSDTEWKSTFNQMCLKTGDKEDWKFKVSEKFANLAEDTDWNTKFTKIEGGSNADDPWENKINEIILRSDDRQSHWETKFIPIAENTEAMNPWDTTFNKIGTPEGEEIWSTTFFPISSEENVPEDWSTTFIDIDDTIEDENEWTISKEDIPDNFNVPEDWSTVFNYIENHECNVLWDTFFNKIAPPDAELEIWLDELYTTDLTDMEREMWETQVNTILPNEGEEYDWTITNNQIEVQDD